MIKSYFLYTDKLAQRNLFEGSASLISLDLIRHQQLFFPPPSLHTVAHAAEKYAIHCVLTSCICSSAFVLQDVS